MAPPLLPDTIDDDELSASLRDSPYSYVPAVEAIAARHGLDARVLAPCPDGSRPVFTAEAGWRSCTRPTTPTTSGRNARR